MQPSEDLNRSSTPSADGANITGRFTFSINSFRAVAGEVAQKLGLPIAICRRGDHEAGSSAIPYENKPLSEAQKDGSDILEVVNPPVEQRLHEAVVGALAQIPGGPALDRYFGISTNEPEQPPQEAARADELVEDLRSASSGGVDLSELLGKIAAHNASSGVDPEALRALMRKSAPKRQDKHAEMDPPPVGGNPT